MAPDYSPVKFDNVQLNMTKDEIIKIIGEPLKHIQDTVNNEIIENYYYTNDGKILNENMPWYLVNDYAWYRSGIQLDSKNRVINIDKGWSYD
jgi:hypothetical protein